MEACKLDDKIGRLGHVGLLYAVLADFAMVGATVCWLRTLRTDVSRHRGQVGLKTLRTAEPAGVRWAMSKARLVVTAVVIEGRPGAAVARDYQVARSWVYELVKRYTAEGDAAFEPRSRRPRSSPNATPDQVRDVVILLRRDLREKGLDAGADTIEWHLLHEHHLTVSGATIHRILGRALGG